MKRVDFAIHGMSCGGCVRKVTAALKSLPGVTVENVGVGTAIVLIDPVKTASNRLVEAINAIGFIAEEMPASRNLQQAR